MTSDISVGFPLSEAQTEDLARRLFSHIAVRGTDMAPSILRVVPEIYWDEKVAAAERQHIFGRYPVIAAHSSELPAPRDYRTVQLVNNEIILARQPDGGVRGFVNSCRHRGARLVLQPSGNAKFFPCGYHGWSYSSDGALAAIAHGPTFGDVDKTCLGLIEVPVQERHGFVWVVDDPGQDIDVADWLGPELDSTFTAYGLDTYTCYRHESFHEPVNWKALVDAFVDGYHISAAHAHSVAPYFYNNVVAFDHSGLHARFVTARRSIDRIRQEAPGAEPLDEHISVGYYLRPHTNLLRQPDHFVLLTFLPHPSDPEQCRMDVRLLVPMAHEGRRGRWDKNWTILQDVLRDEDLVLNRNLQHAMRNRGVQPFLLGRNEIGNQWFHSWLREAVPVIGAMHEGDAGVLADSNGDAR